MVDGPGALDAVLQNTDALTQGSPCLYIESKSWEMLVPHMVECCSLSPMKGKDDPRTIPTVALEGMRMVAKLFRLHLNRITTHPTSAIIRDTQVTRMLDLRIHGRAIGFER